VRLGGLVGRRHLGLLIAQERTCILWYEREEKLLVRCYLDGLTKSNMPRLYSREPTLDLANDGSLMTEAFMLGPLNEFFVDERGILWPTWSHNMQRPAAKILG